MGHYNGAMRRKSLFIIAVVAVLALAGCGRSPAPQLMGRQCVVLGWFEKKPLAEAVLKEISQGTNAQVALAKAARAHPEQVLVSRKCLDVTQLDPRVYKALVGVKLGAASGVFRLRDGWAIAVRTTDRFFAKARDLLRSRACIKAEQLLMKDLSLNPTRWQAWHMLGLCRAATGRFKLAIEAYEKARAWSGDSPVVLNDEASALLAMGKLAPALGLYRRAVRAAPNNPVFLNNYASALLAAREQLELAETMACKATRIDPQQSAYWDTLGRIQAARGEHLKAVGSFARALRLGPRWPELEQRLIESVLRMDEDKLALFGKCSPTPQGTSAVSASSSKASSPSPTPSTSSAAVARVRPKTKASCYVQVSTVRAYARAAKILRRFRARGYPGKVERWVDSKGRVWFRVLIGPYPKRILAAGAARAFRKSGLARDYVVLCRP